MTCHKSRHMEPGTGDKPGVQVEYRLAMAFARGSVLLLDGASLACLAFSRSLGRAGIRVTVAESAPSALAGLSRFCSSYRQYPSPLEQPASFREWLFREVRDGNYDMVAGTTDFTIPLLQEWGGELRSQVLLPITPKSAFQLVFDKGLTITMARRVGLTTPSTFFLQSQEEAEKFCRQGAPNWPLVIKPRRSVVTTADGQRMSTHVSFAWDSSSLRAKLAHPQPDGEWPLVQEYVEGTGIGCFFLIHEGRVVRQFQHRRIRDKNPTGSGSCYRIGTPPTPELMQASERLLLAAGWEGMAMVEFRAAPSGPPYLMEVNGRPWGSMHLAMESGVDFPLVWWQCVTRKSVEIDLNYKAGVRSRHLAGDLHHLERVMLGPPRGWTLAYPKRLPTLLSFFQFWGPMLHYDDFAEGDHRPGWFGLRKYFVELWGRVAAKVRRRGEGKH